MSEPFHLGMQEVILLAAGAVCLAAVAIVAVLLVLTLFRDKPQHRDD